MKRAMIAGKSFLRLRTLDRLDGARMRVWRFAATSAVAAVLAFWLVTAVDGRDLLGKPIGTDFVSFWSAARLALMPGFTPYDPTVHAAFQARHFGINTGYYAFFYPPPFLLTILPLGLLPYGAALLVWLSATGAAYAVVVRRWLGWRMREALPLMLAFPPVLLNIGHGQNGFLTASLFGGGLSLLQRRPVMAGLLLGALVVKPHIAILLPLALAARGEWRAFVATGASAAAFCIVSYVYLGGEAWSGFMAGGALARETMEVGLVSPAKMVSLFAATRVIGAPLWAAYALQTVAAAMAAVLVWLAARRKLPADAQNALLAAATLAISPFMLDYDLTLMALTLAWLLTRTRESFLPYEKAAMLAIFIAPIVLRPLASAAGIPLAPAMIFGLIVLCWRRATLTASPCRHSHAASGQ